jgi:hypothetical protein
VAVLFSGGTDSTASAALLTQRFGGVDLCTLRRAGFFGAENSAYNRGKLVARYPEIGFRHFVYETTPLARRLTNDGRWRHVLRYGFFTLQMCGFCAYTNQVATIAHCLRWGLTDLADGITHDWPFFPAHMDRVIDLFRDFARSFGITYHTPVLHCAVDNPMTYLHKITNPGEAEQPAPSVETTGRILKRLGLSDTENYKGTALDKQAQARCFQFMLPNLLAYWVYDAPHRWEGYEATVVAYFSELLEDARRLLSEWHEQGMHRELFAFVDDRPAFPA